MESGLWFISMIHLHVRKICLNVHIAVFYFKSASVFQFPTINQATRGIQSEKDDFLPSRNLQSAQGGKNIKCNSKWNRLPVIRAMQMPCKCRKGKDLFQLAGSQGLGRLFKRGNIMNVVVKSKVLNFSRKGPDSKYWRFCGLSGPYSVCYCYSTLLFIVWKQPQTLRCCTLIKLLFMDIEIWISYNFQGPYSIIVLIPTPPPQPLKKCKNCA